MFDKDTEELFEELQFGNDVEAFIATNQGEFKKPLHEYLNKLLQEKILPSAKLSAK